MCLISPNRKIVGLETYKYRYHHFVYNIVVYDIDIIIGIAFFRIRYRYFVVDISNKVGHGHVWILGEVESKAQLKCTFRENKMSVTFQYL